MSKSININLFRSSINAFCAAKAERPLAFASFLADNLASALESTLIDGSDAINQALLVLKNAGKTGLAPKFRKIVNSADWAPVLTWATVHELVFIKASGYIGGNSQKCVDKDQRRDAIELVRENIKSKGLEIFTPSAKDVDVDPLAMFGKFNSEKVDEILSKASAEQLSACLARLNNLVSHVSTALSTALIATEAATEAATDEPASVVKVRRNRKAEKLAA